MTYEEAYEADVTREEAKREIAKHDGVTFAEFIEDIGDRETYGGAEVLDWLGY